MTSSFYAFRISLCILAFSVARCEAAELNELKDLNNEVAELLSGCDKRESWSPDQRALIKKCAALGLASLRLNGEERRVAVREFSEFLRSVDAHWRVGGDLSTMKFAATIRWSLHSSVASGGRRTVLSPVRQQQVSDQKRWVSEAKNQLIRALEMRGCHGAKLIKLRDECDRVFDRELTSVLHPFFRKPHDEQTWQRCAATTRERVNNILSQEIARLDSDLKKVNNEGDFEAQFLLGFSAENGLRRCCSEIISTHVEFHLSQVKPSDWSPYTPDSIGMTFSFNLPLRIILTPNEDVDLLVVQ